MKVYRSRWHRLWWCTGRNCPVGSDWCCSSFRSCRLGFFWHDSQQSSLVGNDSLSSGHTTSSVVKGQVTHNRGPSLARAVARQWCCSWSRFLSPYLWSELYHIKLCRIVVGARSHHLAFACQVQEGSADESGRRLPAVQTLRTPYCVSNGRCVRGCPP